MNNMTIFIFDAEEGMKLSKDVIHEDGHIIATKDTVLDMDLIAKISEYGILEINVYVPEEQSVSTKVASDDQQTYYDKIRNSEQFKEFSRDYTSNISDFKEQLNDIVTAHEPIDTDKLLAGTTKLLAEYTNSLQLLDMLHSMREFDDLTFMHCVNVALISSIIGKWLHFSPEDIHTLTLAGLLHDVGKLLTPSEILSKPGKLTNDEFEIMKTHVSLGYSELKDQNIDIKIKEACLLHHESCDGSGYPFHLKSEKIPTVAKIISIADVYDAMTATRVYREAICPFKVIDIMAQNAYNKFDPKYLLPFLKNVVSSYIHNDVKLSDGQVGKVILINENALSRPTIQIDENTFIDLSKRKDLDIVAIL